MHVGPLLCVLAATLARFAGSISVQSFREPFPACVDLSELNPPPYSVVNLTKYTTEMELTFSKPVRFNTHLPYKGVSLSSSPRGYIKMAGGISNGQGIGPEVVHAHTLAPSSTGFSKWKATFDFKNSNGPIFRVFYLIIEGAYFHTFDSTLHNIYLPHTIVGPYYVDQREKEYHGNHTVVPLSPSLYCQPRQVRRQPEPLAGGHDKESFIHAQIPWRGHHMMANTPSTIKLLALVNVTEGKQTIPLPHSVTVNISGIEYDVELPKWNLTFDIPLTVWKADVKQTMLVELNERIYHTLSPGFAYTRRSELEVATVMSYKSSKFSFPFYVWRMNGEVEEVDIMAWKSGPILKEYRRRVKESVTWYEIIRSGTVFYKPHHSKRLPDPYSTKNTKLFPQKVRQCPAGSPRNPGRRGHTYHAMETGPFYQMVEVSPPDTWTLQHTTLDKEENPPMFVKATLPKGVNTVMPF